MASLSHLSNLSVKLGRTIGWITHWNEMHTNEDFRIGRPRQVYTGKEKRDVKPLRSRK